MAIDRQSIEKKDFPIGRRGYEPEAVDEHLNRLADEIETLQRSMQRRSGASLAQAASQQVQAIVEAAEQSAQAIERDAEAEAARIRADAEREAERAESEAQERSREYVASVNEQTTLMLQRVDAMEGELGALIESLRTGANRLNADLALLEGNLGELYQAAGGTPPRAPEAAAPAPRAAAPTPPPAPAPPAPAAVEEDEVGDEEPPAAAAPPARAPAPPAPPAQATPPAEPAPVVGGEGDGGDVEGARLIALNMALNGQSREETDRYLAENFELPDRAGLLDEVYESVS